MLGVVSYGRVSAPFGDVCRSRWKKEGARGGECVRLVYNACVESIESIESIGGVQQAVCSAGQVTALTYKSPVKFLERFGGVATAKIVTLHTTRVKDDV